MRERDLLEADGGGQAAHSKLVLMECIRVHQHHSNCSHSSFIGLLLPRHNIQVISIRAKQTEREREVEREMVLRSTYSEIGFELLQVRGLEYFHPFLGRALNKAFGVCQRKCLR